MILRVALLFGAALATPMWAGAQTRATSADLAGIVRDATEAVLPGAMVTATNIATNQSRSTTTGQDGRFVIPALPAGNLRRGGRAPGFRH